MTRKDRNALYFECLYNADLLDMRGAHTVASCLHSVAVKMLGRDPLKRQDYQTIEYARVVLYEKSFR